MVLVFGVGSREGLDIATSESERGNRAVFQGVGIVKTLGTLC
jgi:hypothetical protein